MIGHLCHFLLHHYDIMINTNNIINDINDITEQLSHKLDCSLVCGIPRLRITYASSFGPDILQ